MKCHDLTGKRYGNLTVISKSAPINGRSNWLCKCDCGNETIVRTSNLESGHTKSCGCYKRMREIEANTVHGLSNTRIHRIWDNMKTRCLNKNSPAFRFYGGRGITICEEWLNDRSKFFEWALSNGYSDNLTIERIDNDKGYYPDNCAWVTKEMQYKNKRQNIMITYDGKTLCAEDWSKVTGIPSMTIRWRYKHGWSAERTLTTKPYTKGE